MNKKAHRIILIFLLLLISTSTLYYVLLDLKQVFANQEAHNILYTSTNQLEKIKIPLELFSTIENENEIWIEGKMYDIKSYHVDNDSVMVTVYHDESEEAIVNTIIFAFNADWKYCAENETHIIKYKFHLPDDSKIVNSIFTLYRILKTANFVKYPDYKDVVLSLAKRVPPLPPEHFIV